EAAVAAAAAAISAGVRDFAAGALHPENPGEIGGHLLVVEFERGVSEAELARFAETLDRDLMRRNLDYEAHRAGGYGLHAPQVIALHRGGFAEWMRRRGRLGSQNKVPRVLAELELAFAVGAASECRPVGLARCENPHLGIGHRLAVTRRELDRHVVPRKQIERRGRRWNETGDNDRREHGANKAERTDLRHHDAGYRKRCCAVIGRRPRPDRSAARTTPSRSASASPPARAPPRHRPGSTQ